MKRGLIFGFLIIVFGIFLVNGVFAQADVCFEEAVSLSTATQKIYLNEPLYTARTVISRVDLPNVLSKGTFSGNVQTDYDQSINIGGYPKVIYAKEPSPLNDPSYVLKFITVSSKYLYDSSITFSQALDFTDPNSIGEPIILFGKEFIVSPETDKEKLVLFENGVFLALNNRNPVRNVNIKNEEYSIELISASDTAATVKVIDNKGNSDSKTISEESSKVIENLIVAVENADETNLEISANLVIGSDKIRLTNEGGINKGAEERYIDGTNVKIEGGLTATTKIHLYISASDSDHDAILPGESFIDPVFGTFKVYFFGLNIPTESDKRETIKINNLEDDKMQLTFKARYADAAKTIIWVKNLPNLIQLAYDDDVHKISVFENEQIYRNGYVVVGNEESGRLIKVSIVYLSSSSYTDDKVEFTDVLSGDIYTSTITGKGIGTVNIGGKSYSIAYGGTSSSDSNWVRINYPDSRGPNSAVIYPTIYTEKGAKLAFYEPVKIDLSNWNGAGDKLNTLKFPTGNGYEDARIEFTPLQNGLWNVFLEDYLGKVVSLSDLNPKMQFSAKNKYIVELISATDTAATIKVSDDTGKSETKEINEGTSQKILGINIRLFNADENNLRLSADILIGVDLTLDTLDKNSFVRIPIGHYLYASKEKELAYKIFGSGEKDKIVTYLENPKTGKEIVYPALILFEEEYKLFISEEKGAGDPPYISALIVTLEAGNIGGRPGIGVDEIIRTWNKDSEWDNIAHAHDNTKVSEADAYGTIVTIDSINPDQKTAIISYPDEQLYANIFISSNLCKIENKFIRGDANKDGRVDLTDAVFILNWLFKGGETPKCLDAADVDDSGNVGITDAIKLLNFLFQGEQAPPAPYPEAGVDPTEDTLSCDG